MTLCSHRAAGTWLALITEQICSYLAGSPKLLCFIWGFGPLMKPSCCFLGFSWCCAPPHEGLRTWPCVLHSFMPHVCKGWSRAWR